MDAAVQKIFMIYKSNFPQQTMKCLSRDTANGIDLVFDTTPAFDFDSITKQLHRRGLLDKDEKPKSVDALYMNNKVCFIEFKRGIKPGGNNNDKYLQNAIESAQDSYLTHEKFLSINGGISPSTAHNFFVLVINSSAGGSPSQAYASALSARANLPDSIKTHLTANLLSPFENGARFTSVDVWNDVNFGIKLKLAT